ncbi:hypothetical protein MT_57025 [Pseudomonas phage phiPto-bp6g]|nr:hypothetical protein MT_57025 [Pseudomonas phage phiPto-bp6g]
MRRATNEKDPYSWHEWFVWYPIWVHTGHCKGTWIFWERVQRKRNLTYAGVDTQIRNLDGSVID